MSTNTVQSTGVTSKEGVGIGYRHVMYALLFTSEVIAYGMRTVLNVAIVSMISVNSKPEDYPVYPEWKEQKNILLSSFFWGYICLQVGAGQIAKNYGPKLFLGGALFIASLFSILIPVFGATFGYVGVIICRIIQGLCQGFLLPSTHNLLSAWAPLSERSKWGGVIYTGMALGNVIAMPLTGAICSTKAGWPVIFYLYGGLGIIWCTLWFIFGSDSPAKHKNISVKEKKWIESDIKEGSEDYSKIPTPWKSIFTSVPFIALIFTHVTQNWGFWTVLTEIPSFMDKIMGLDIASNSFLSALPYLVMFLLGFVMSPIAEMLIDRKIVSVTVSRKLFNTLGFAVPALALISLIFVQRGNVAVTMVILVIAVGVNAGQLSGFNLNHIDLSPVHAGTLIAITNSTATVASILAPLSVDIFKSISGYDENDKELWNIVFCTAGIVYLAGTIIFDIFGSGELQPWPGFAVPAFALISLIFVERGNVAVTIVILVIAVGVNAGQLSGYNLNHIDLSPVHAGTLMAITNSTACLASILAPLSVDIFKSVSGYGENDKELWNIVFCTAGGVYLAGTIIFDIFGSGELQPWSGQSDKITEELTADDKARLKIMRKISTTMSM